MSKYADITIDSEVELPNGKTIGEIEELHLQIEPDSGATEPYIEETYDENNALVGVKFVGHTVIRCAAYNGSHTDNRLKTIQLPNELIEIKSNAFWGNSELESITLPEKLETIGSSAFANTKISSLIIPASVKNIGSYSFSINSDISRTIKFLGTPTSIASNAFQDVSMRRCYVYVPWSEDQVDGAPWGIQDAEIHYNWTER